MLANNLKQMDTIAVDENQPPSQSIMEQFEHLVVSSLFKAFGLNPALFNDQNGGNVDTLVTARKYGIKDEQARQAYDKRSAYNSNDYHGGGKSGSYGSKNATLSKMRDDGTLVDAYTGESLNGKFDLDHVISAKKIHGDPARLLAGLDGVELANQDTNLNATNFSINRSKNADTMDEVVARLQQRQAANEQKLKELKSIKNPTPEQQKQIEKHENLLKADFELMKKADKKARAVYNAQLGKAYYASGKFLKPAGKDAAITGYKMGLRQVLGLLFTEIWISVRKGIKNLIQKMKQNFQIKEFFIAIADIFKSTIQNIIIKYKKFIETFKEGLIAGVLSSITTTIVNIFIGTAKRVVQVIRECWASIVEISKILFFCDDHTTFSQKMKAVAKILVGLATVLLGTLIHEAVLKIPGLGQFDDVSDALAIFLSAFLTGIISIGLLYFIDHAQEVKQFFTFSYWLRDNIKEQTAYYENVNKQLAQKASELAQITYQEIEELIGKVRSYNEKIENASTKEELNCILTSIVKAENINMSYETKEQLRKKMLDKTTKFVFE
ncbi:hypothetical protein [Psychrobacillus lasiicapitis]|uniref:DNA repair protein n=1 Tax=Psychrobacillus lasiicapitis TaxID=1636719 RepID=A0A544T010_9BACI|nr:hypothetical protein [Psychrobacillus lasiicapitis]TQR10720.1 hypothetical protein FG382_16785 [Psychrobacillus lasiicapitis]GGA43078.1 hypothetical protein GCM10011384_36060 [Psychrobacillus lasiicapitis]